MPAPSHVLISTHPSGLTGLPVWWDHLPASFPVGGGLRTQAPFFRSHPGLAVAYCLLHHQHRHSHGAARGQEGQEGEEAAPLPPSRPHGRRPRRRHGRLETSGSGQCPRAPRVRSAPRTPWQSPTPPTLQPLGAWDPSPHTHHRRPVPRARKTGSTHACPRVAAPTPLAAGPGRTVPRTTLYVASQLRHGALTVTLLPLGRNDFPPCPFSVPPVSYL